MLRPWVREQEAKLDRGEWTDPAQGRVTVGEYAQDWLRGKVKLKVSTRAAYDSLLREHVAPTWGRVPLSAVRHEDVSAWVQRLHASGLSASRTRQAFIVLAQVLDLAVKARRIPANPARGVELPSLPSNAERPMRALDERQVWAVADAAGDERLSVLVLAWCGLRFGELAGLRVRHFDVLGRELRVETALSEVAGRLVEASPKTSASVRTVPVPVSSGRTTCGTPARRSTSRPGPLRRCCRRCSVTPRCRSLSTATATCIPATFTSTSTASASSLSRPVRTGCGLGLAIGSLRCRSR